MPLTTPTVLRQTVTSISTPFTTNILIVGGAYAGLAAIKSLQDHLTQKSTLPQYKSWFDDQTSKISITLVEPRAGFLNIIGIPRAIVDPDFAKTQYVAFSELNGLQFDKVISKDEQVAQSLTIEGDSTNGKFGFELTYVQGSVTYLDEHKAQYQLNEDSAKAIIDFDYVILASGRDRSWPTTPEAYTFNHYMKEMNKAHEEIDKHQIISVIGGGAVGIEIAGDVKNRFPEKIVNLIHPHEKFPPEPLSTDFQDAIHDSLLRGGVKLYTNTRISEESSNGDLKTTKNETIKSSYNFWCTSHKNNTEILSNDLKAQFVTSKRNIRVNEYLQLSADGSEHPNFFVIGDLVDFPIIKSAGWAMYMGRQTANNITSLILDHRLLEPFPDLSVMPSGMVLVGGNEEIVSELGGEVSLNHEHYVQEYKDYCIGKVRATLGL
ncbi:NADH dehydrogenase, internal, ubiquinone [Scheffersomyces xylosifermentans]|uniref:NADH dehydrogenase, internal, ubiquinone n=1 Tax=Scheffersomyces xylosifermentans TaxID=1304137 RepID=UPI00315D1219